MGSAPERPRSVSRNRKTIKINILFQYCGISGYSCMIAEAAKDKTPTMVKESTNAMAPTMVKESTKAMAPTMAKEPTKAMAPTMTKEPVKAMEPTMVKESPKATEVAPEASPEAGAGESMSRR